MVQELKFDSLLIGSAFATTSILIFMMKAYMNNSEPPLSYYVALVYQAEVDQWMQ